MTQLNVSPAVLRSWYTAAFGPGAQLALHSDNPGPAGHNAELRGRGYLRQPAGFSVDASQVALSSTVIFTDLPITQVTHWSVWQQGQFQSSGAFSDIIRLVNARNELRLEPGDIVIEIGSTG